jgi:hypothetical protein
VRWPIWGSRFNTRDYPSTAMIIDDIETILETSLQDSLGINRREYKVSFLSGHGCAYILKNTEGLLSCVGNTRLLRSAIRPRHDSTVANPYGIQAVVRSAGTFRFSFVRHP